MTRFRYGTVALWLFLTVNTGVIAYFWWLGSNKLVFGDLGQQLIAFCRFSGLLLVLLVLLQLLLIGRTGWLEKSIGFDKLARWHHRMGFGLLSLIIAHPLLISSGYALRNSNSPYRQFLNLLSWEDVDNALIATVIFGIVITLSIVIVLKRMKYETWYYVHLMVYLAILLSFGHQLNVGRSLQDRIFAAFWIALYAFVFLNHLYYRFFLPLHNHLMHSFKAEKIVYEAEGCFSIYLSGKNLDRFKFIPGQYAIFRFLAKGFWYEAHPFSFSQTPNGKALRITVKNLGDFTARLKNLKPGSTVIIDGPLGIFTLRRRTKEKILLIAGGIGMTPIRTLAEDATVKRIDTVLLYGGRDIASLALKNEIDDLTKSEYLRAHYILNNQEDWGGEKGYIDQEKISRLVPDFAERDLYLCGPAPMMKMVTTAAAGLNIPKEQIHFEKFSL